MQRKYALIRPIPTVTGLLLVIALLLVQTSLLIHALEHADHPPEEPCELCLYSSNLGDIGATIKNEPSTLVYCDKVISLPYSSHSTDFARLPGARGPPA